MSNIRTIVIKPKDHIKPRNWVAKHNFNRAERHHDCKQYQRHAKHPHQERQENYSGTI